MQNNTQKQRRLTEGLLAAVSQATAAQNNFENAMNTLLKASETLNRVENNINRGILPGKKPVAKKGQLASYAEKAWAYVPPVRKSARLQAQKNKTQLEKVKEARTKRAALKKKYTKNEINMLTAQRKNKETRERNVLRRKLQDIDNAARPNSTKLRREVGNLRRRINLKTRVIDELNYNLKFNANKGFIQRLLR